MRGFAQELPDDAAPCLLCVDLQQEYAAPGRPLAGTADPKTLEACRRVLRHARANDWLVVHSVLECDRGLFGRGGAHTRPIPTLEPKASEQVLVRDSLSVMSHPAVARAVWPHSRELHVIGFSLSHTLLSTVFDAASCGLRMVLIEDAIGATPVSGLSAAQVKTMARRLLAPFASFTTFDAVIGREGPRLVPTAWPMGQRDGDFR